MPRYALLILSLLVAAAAAAAAGGAPRGCSRPSWGRPAPRPAALVRGRDADGDRRLTRQLPNRPARSRPPAGAAPPRRLLQDADDAPSGGNATTTPGNETRAIVIARVQPAVKVTPGVIVTPVAMLIPRWGQLGGGRRQAGRPCATRQQQHKLQ
jgi:hypothetical protein